MHRSGGVATGKVRSLKLLQTETHLDCGSVSVLSFNSSSETSVSRISGLDLFPYLRRAKTQDRQIMMIHLKGLGTNGRREINEVFLCAHSRHGSHYKASQIRTQSGGNAAGANTSCIAGGHISLSVPQMISRAWRACPFGLLNACRGIQAADIQKKA